MRKLKKLHENWRPEEPPSGDGYQLWETTTEGSPKSPVFESPEELAEWLVDHNVSFFGECGLDYYEWLRFIRENAEQDQNSNER